MMKLAMIGIALTLCAVPLGCSEFASEKDELAYLSTVANPTPRQWNRRNELAKAQAVKDAEQSAQRDRQNVDLAKKWAVEVAAKKAKEAQQDLVDAAELLAKGEEHERRSEANLARVDYHDVLTKYPATPQAAVAAARLKVVGVK